MASGEGLVMSVSGESKKETVSRRMSVRFEGRVQGVGFRYTVVEVAAGYAAVSGYVSNQPDGSVTLVAEGSEQDLVGLMRDIKSTHLARYIANDYCVWSPATGEFTGFTVRHAWCVCE